MAGEKVSEKLMTLLRRHAGRTSSFNMQPWRFIYAMRDTKEFDTVFFSNRLQQRLVQERRGARRYYFTQTRLQR